MPQQFSQQTVESLSQTIADPNSPDPSLVTAGGILQLMGEKGLPALPSLLEAVAREQDRGLSRHLEMAIQRFGPKAVPGVRDALKNASSDETTAFDLYAVRHGNGRTTRSSGTAQEQFRNSTALVRARRRGLAAIQLNLKIERNFATAVMSRMVRQSPHPKSKPSTTPASRQRLTSTFTCNRKTLRSRDGSIRRPTPSPSLPGATRVEFAGPRRRKSCRWC